MCVAAGGRACGGGAAVTAAVRSSWPGTFNYMCLDDCAYLFELQKLGKSAAVNKSGALSWPRRRPPAANRQQLAAPQGACICERDRASKPVHVGQVGRASLWCPRALGCCSSLDAGVRCKWTRDDQQWPQFCSVKCRDGSALRLARRAVRTKRDQASGVRQTRCCSSHAQGGQRW